VTTAEGSEAADRARRLQRVAELLAEAVTPQEVLDSILTEGVRAAEAHAGAIGVLSEDGTSVELLAQRGYDVSVMAG
jgi:GAF domain-containing protein